MPDIYDMKEVQAMAEPLKEEFKAVHGDDAFNRVYIGDFNEKPSMQPDSRADQFNRSAHIPLMAYFMCHVLDKPPEIKEKLLRTFRVDAVKPMKGTNEPFTCDTDKIIDDLHDSAALLLGDHSGGADNEGWNTPAPGKAA